MPLIEDLIYNGPIRGLLKKILRKKGVLEQITIPVTALDVAREAQTTWARNAAKGWMARITQMTPLTPEQAETLERSLRIAYAAGMLGVREDPRMMREAYSILEQREGRAPPPAAPPAAPPPPTAPPPAPAPRRRTRTPTPPPPPAAPPPAPTAPPLPPAPPPAGAPSETAPIGTVKEIPLEGGRVQRWIMTAEGWKLLR